MYKNNIIAFFVLIVVWGISSEYFSVQIDQKNKEYAQTKKLMLQYNGLKNKYSNNMVSNKKKKIIDFLNLFDIK